MATIKQNIDFLKIAEETGVRKGSVFYSPTFNSWVIKGHPEIDLICIEPPYNVGDILQGKKVETVKIKNNQWVFDCASLITQK